MSKNDRYTDLSDKFGKAIEIPASVGAVTGLQNIRAFSNGDKVTLHFPDIQREDKGKTLLNKFTQAFPDTTAYVSGGEFGLRVSALPFHQKFDL